MEQMLSEVFKEILEKKFEEGYINTLVSESIDKCLKDVVNNLFTRYDSELKKQLEEKIKPVISNAIANSDMEGYVEKLTILTNQLINQRELSDISQFKSDCFDDILGASKKYKYGDTETLSSILNMYKEWVEPQLKDLKYNDEDWSYDDGVGYVDWTIGIEEVEEEDETHSYFKSKESKYRLYTRPDDPDIISEYEDYDFDIVFSLYKGYDHKLHLSIDGNITLRELAYLPKFLVTLYYISSKCCYIEEDIYDKSFDVEVEIEKEYE